jgi:hypothetical protein
MDVSLTVRRWEYSPQMGVSVNVFSVFALVQLRYNPYYLLRHGI